MLLKDPHNPDIFFHTGWDPEANGGKPVHLVREDGETKIRPEDISIGGQITAFPGIPDGTTNKYADSPVLLIRLRQKDAQLLQDNIEKGYPLNRGGMAGDLVAYSKICTHAGCAVSIPRSPLYPPRAPRPALVCPCHYSTFDPAKGADVIFGPAGRALPQLPLSIDPDGTLVAAGELSGDVGPAWRGTRT
jgi:quinol---cytochrome c reductase iron-sulfur subunit